MRKPSLFKRIQYSKKLAEKCSAVLKSVTFMNDFDILIKIVEDENGVIG